MESTQDEELFSYILYNIQITSAYFNRYKFANKNLIIIEEDMTKRCLKLKYYMRNLIMNVNHNRIDLFDIIDAREVIFSLLRSLNNLKYEFIATFKSDRILVSRVSKVIDRCMENYQSYYIMLKKKCK